MRGVLVMPAFLETEIYYLITTLYLYQIMIIEVLLVHDDITTIIYLTNKSHRSKIVEPPPPQDVL